MKGLQDDVDEAYRERDQYLQVLPPTSHHK
jgi:hypothetical protein